MLKIYPSRPRRDSPISYKRASESGLTKGRIISNSQGIGNRCMLQALKDKIEEISLMLVMTAEGDAAGYTLLRDLTQDALNIAADTSGMERIAAAATFVIEQYTDPKFLEIVSHFASTALQLLEGSTTGSFSNENKPKDDLHAIEDVGSHFDPQFLAEFIETHVLLLEDFEASLLDYQNSGGDPDELATILKRYIHNLKGDAGSIGLVGIERVCHAVEDTLNERTTASAIGMLLGFKEWVASCLAAFTNGFAPKISATEYLATLPSHAEAFSDERSSETLSEPTYTSSSSTNATYTLSGERDILVEFAVEAEEHLNAVESLLLDTTTTLDKDAVDTIFRAVHSVKGGSAYFCLEEMTQCSHILENFLVEVRDGKRDFDKELKSLLLVYVDLQKDVLRRAREEGIETGMMTRSPDSEEFLQTLDLYAKGQSCNTTRAVAPAANPPAPSSDASEIAAEGKGDKLAVKSFVKVDTARLDHLIDSIGEMVIYSSMLIRHCRELLGGDERVMDTTHRVEKFSRDLQDIGMSMRLVPIKGLFQKMSRLVWDTSKKLGKDVTFVMEGEETELDRNLIDKLADPLMHMVRNSLDHGVEPPEERLRAGKPAQGRVTLSAFHSGGSIHIRIADDGRGLNPEKLIAKAVERGIVSPNQRLSDSEAFQLIFAPGFSTAATVTDISGRGVGMDVVRRNVESLRGRINITSTVGQGSVFTIELPLTLAIIDGVQIRVGSEDFLIPSLSIVEFIRAKREMINSTLDRGETLSFRGKFLPVYRLSDLYGISPQFEDPERAAMVVVENDNELVAIMVDEILGECSTVIKSLGSIFGEGRGIAGCSILPQGTVALILDVRSLVQLARHSYRASSATQQPSTIEVVQH